MNAHTQIAPPHVERGSHPVPRRLAAILSSIMRMGLEAEASAICRTTPFQRSPIRAVKRAGSYRRLLVTRFGNIPLKVPRFVPSGNSSVVLQHWTGSADALADQVIRIAAGHNTWSSIQAILTPLRQFYGEANWIIELQQRVLRYADQIRMPMLPVSASHLAVVPVEACGRGLGCAPITAWTVGTPDDGATWFSQLEDRRNADPWPQALASVRAGGLLNPVSITGPADDRFAAAARRCWPQAGIAIDPTIIALG